jgi:hypothetical protein
VHIRWTKDFTVEQHLEGGCKDFDKITIEIHEDLNLPTTRLLNVLQVASSSDGTLKIFVDTSKGEH